MQKKKLTLKYVIISLLIFLIILIFLIYKNQSSIIKKGYQLAPGFMNIARFYIFNLPNNIPNIPSNNPIESDLNFKKSLKNLTFKKSYSKNMNFFNKNKKIKIYMPKENYLLSGISNKYAGSSYVAMFNEELIILSSRGLLANGKIQEDEIILKQIKNNLNDFLGIEAFKKDRSYSFKDLLIHDQKIYVSLTDEVSNKCWSTSVLYSEINFNYLKFKYLFKSEECIDEKNDEAFVPIQSGGRIAVFDQNNLLLSTGDYRYRKKAQEPSSIFGKIININLESGDYKIISMGHRNPQGLYVDKKNKILLSTEHGPRGGDEINLISFEDLEKKILNFGWPVSSYGEHYAKKNATSEEAIRKVNLLYKKYPLHKSHKKHGFIEPLHFFNPSIGISEIIGIGNSKYISSSLGGKQLFFFDLTDNNKLNNYYVRNIGERVRDVIFKDKKLIFFLEDTASIALVNF